MSYSKPMVTIELDEYNDLLKTKEDFNKGEHLAKQDILPYKKAISAMLVFSSRILSKESYYELIQVPRVEDVMMAIKVNPSGSFEVHCEPKFKNDK